MRLKHQYLRVLLLGGGTGAIALCFSSAPASATLLAEDDPLADVHLVLEVDALETEVPAIAPWVERAESLSSPQIVPSTLSDLEVAFPSLEGDLTSAEVLTVDGSVERTSVPLAQNLMPLNSDLARAGQEDAADSQPQPQSESTLAQVRPASDRDGWEFVIEPYIFVPFNVQTDISVGGTTQSVSVGLGDLFSLDRIFAGALRFEARQPQYGFFADLSHVYVREGRGITGFPLPPTLAGLATQRTGIPIPPGTPVDAAVRATGRTTTFDVGGYYRVVDQYLGRTEAEQPTYPRLLVDPYLGLRVVRLGGDLNFDFNVGGLPLNNVPVTQSATLVKPLLGGQVGLELSDRWALGLRGSIAGLGIGADENFAWSLLAGARYRVSERAALQLAYQFKESRYSSGQGVSRFAVNQTQQGIWLGVDIGL